MKNIRLWRCVAVALCVLFVLSVAAAFAEEVDLAELLDCAEKGDADAQCRLGIMLLTGQNFKKDEEQAVYWFKKSAGQGNVEAQILLAFSYFEGVERDEARAFKLAKTIAEKDPGSINIKNIHGVEEIYSSVEELVAAAQIILGVTYYEGRGGVQKDLEQAEYWFDKAVEHVSESLKEEAERVLKKVRAEKAEKAQTPTAPVQPQPRAEQLKSESVIEVGINQLLQGYEDNKIAAKRKYDGKRIRLSGFVNEIDEDKYGDKKIFIYLTENKAETVWVQPRGVKCYFNNRQDESFMKIQEGQFVTIEGICEIDYPVQLSNSRVVTDNAESVMKIDLEQAVEECRANQLVYKRKYEGKKVRVSEKIFVIGTHPYDGRIYVRLSYKDHSSDGGINDLYDLYCYFEENEADNVMKLKVGQRVTIEGTFEDIVPFSLAKCRIVSGSQSGSQSTPQPAQSAKPAPSEPKPQPAQRGALTDEEFLKLCRSGTAQEVAEAIRNWANVNAKNKYGWTALMYASRDNPNPEVITALVKAGADVNVKDKNGLTALDLAEGNNALKGTDAIRLLGGSPVQSQQPHPDAGIDELMKELDEAARDFAKREGISASTLSSGSIYVIKSYAAQFKAIKGNGAALFREPTTSSECILDLPNGTKLNAEADFTSNSGEDWYYVQSKDGTKGWVHSKFIVDGEPDDGTSGNARALTDSEYKQMLKDPDFAKAERSLNAAWANAKKSMKAKDFEALKQEQAKWISGGRDSQARERMNDNMEEKSQAYATVTLARAYYVAHRARGEMLMLAIPTGNKINVRSKPVNGKVLYQVSNDYGDDGEGGDLLIVDGNPVKGGGENWHKVLYRVSVNEGAAEKANGFIVGRFIRLEPLPILDWRYAN